MHSISSYSVHPHTQDTTAFVLFYEYDINRQRASLSSFVAWCTICPLLYLSGDSLSAVDKANIYLSASRVMFVYIVGCRRLASDRPSTQCRQRRSMTRSPTCALWRLYAIQLLINLFISTRFKLTRVNAPLRAVLQVAQVSWCNMPSNTHLGHFFVRIATNRTVYLPRLCVATKFMTLNLGRQM